MSKRWFPIWILLASGLVASTEAVAAPPGLPLSEINSDSRHINAVQPNTALVTHGSVTYVCYINSAMEAVVAARSTSGGAWSEEVVGTGVLDDAHNVCSIGVDPSGNIHVAWDLHDTSSWTGHYARTTTPGDITTFSPASIGGTSSSSISYPFFYRAGSNFYLLFRNGSSGHGEMWMKKFASGSWTDVAVPLIDGLTPSPDDNPYIGNLATASNGDLHLVWTARVGEYNHGVFYARYNAGANTWHRANGTSYSLPLRRDTAENILADSLVDASLSNTGLAVSLGSSGTLHVAFSRVSAGFREAFHARYDSGSGAWLITQVSHAQAERIRICTPTDPDPPSPCDLEVQGPQMIVSGNQVALLYAVGVDHQIPGPSFARPPGELYAAVSGDSGVTWITHHLRRDVANLGGEMPRDSSGLPYLLLQEVRAEDAPLSLADASPLLTLPAPGAAAAATLTGGNYVELQDTTAWDHPSSTLTMAAWIRPFPSGRPMAIMEKAGTTNTEREMRLLIWAGGHQISGQLNYSASAIQVALGNGSGAWTLVWYPSVTVPAGSITHLAVTWDGTTVKVYKDGVLEAQTSYSSSLLSGPARPTIGSVRGYSQYVYEGWVSAEYYGTALTADQIELLFEGGRPAP